MSWANERGIRLMEVGANLRLFSQEALLRRRFGGAYGSRRIMLTGMNNAGNT